MLSSHVADAFGGTLALPTGSGADDPYAGYGAQWGYYRDAETGLYLCTFRYYDATEGRWLTPDPAGYMGGVNLLGYSRNNPVILADPDGKSPLATAAMGAVGGALIAGGYAVFNGESWNDVGKSALKGAITGGVAGLTLGFGGPAIAGLVGGGVGGGILSGVVSSALGSAAGQGASMKLGFQCDFSWSEMGWSALIGGVTGSFALRPATSARQPVVTWASRGVNPDLNSGRWVMVGGQTPRNYLSTVGPALRGYPYSNAVTGTVPGNTLQYPGGTTGNLAGLLGQRVVR